MSPTDVDEAMALVLATVAEHQMATIAKATIAARRGLLRREHDKETIGPIKRRRLGRRRRRRCCWSTSVVVVGFDRRLCRRLGFFILFSGNRQMPGLATGAVGHSLFYSRR